VKKKLNAKVASKNEELPKEEEEEEAAMNAKNKALRNRLIKEKQHLLRALLKENHLLSQETAKRHHKETKNINTHVNESYFSDNFDFERSRQRLQHNQNHYEHFHCVDSNTNTTVNSSSCTDLTMTNLHDICSHDDEKRHEKFAMSKHLCHFVSAQSLAHTYKQPLRSRMQQKHATSITNLKESGDYSNSDLTKRNNNNNRVHDENNKYKNRKQLVKAHSCKNLYKKGYNLKLDK
jgi:hypothetical protein